MDALVSYSNPHGTSTTQSLSWQVQVLTTTSSCTYTTLPKSPPPPVLIISLPSTGLRKDQCREEARGSICSVCRQCINGGSATSNEVSMSPVTQMEWLMITIACGTSLMLTSFLISILIIPRTSRGRSVTSMLRWPSLYTWHCVANGRTCRQYLQGQRPRQHVGPMAVLLPRLERQLPPPRPWRPHSVNVHLHTPVPCWNLDSSRSARGSTAGESSYTFVGQTMQNLGVSNKQYYSNAR